MFLYISKKYPFQSEYIPEICGNQILEVGFGPGELKIEGGNLSSPFVYSVEGGDAVYFLSVFRLRSILTFDWFKENSVCHEQAWLCPLDGDYSQQDDFDDQMEHYASHWEDY